MTDPLARLREVASLAKRRSTGARFRVAARKSARTNPVRFLRVSLKKLYNSASHWNFASYGEGSGKIGPAVADATDFLPFLMIEGPICRNPHRGRAPMAGRALRCECGHAGTETNRRASRFRSLAIRGIRTAPGHLTGRSRSASMINRDRWPHRAPRSVIAIAVVRNTAREIPHSAGVRRHAPPPEDTSTH